MPKPDVARLLAPATTTSPTLVRLERGIAYFALYFMLVATTGIVLPLILAGGDIGIKDEDTGPLRLMNLPVLGLPPLLVAMRAREIASELIRNPLIVAIVGLATLSIFWSVNPEFTTRRIMFLLSTTLFAVWAAVRFTPEEFVRHCLYFFIAALIGSFAMAAAVPRLGFMAEGQFRGLFLHKNTFGATAQVAWVFVLVAWRFKLMPAWMVAGCIGLLAVGMVLADSATTLGLSFIVAVGFFALGWATMPPLVAGLLVALGIVGAASAILVVTLLPEVVFALLGRDADLTGRLPLWSFLWEMIKLRPWVGHGYAAFWSMPEYTQHLLDALTWQIPHAHSGYMDSLVGLGAVGLVLAVSLMIGTMARGFGLLRRGHLLVANLLILHLGALIGRNFSESDVMQHVSLIWILWVYLAVTAGRLLAPIETRREPELVDDGGMDDLVKDLPPPIPDRRRPAIARPDRPRLPA